MGDVQSAINRGDNGSNPRHELAIAMKAIGYKNNDICVQTGYEPAYLSTVLTSPEAKAKIEEYQKEMRERTLDVGVRIQEAAADALDVALHWMRKTDDQHAAVAARSAFSILDRAGYGKIEKHIHGHMTLTPEQMKDMKQLAGAADRVIEEFNYGRDVSGLIEGPDSSGGDPEES